MKRAVLLVAALAASRCSVSEPRPAPAPITAPRPPRSYRDLGAPVAVDERQGGVPPASFSPDGKLSAFALADPAGLAFFDVERRAFVARAPLPVGRAHLLGHHFASGGDLLAVVSRAPVGEAHATARYDGRSGALRGVAEGDLRGFVLVHGEVRYVVLDELAGKLELHALTTPEPRPVTITLPKGVERVVVAANGVIVVGLQGSARALDAGGRELWSRPSPLGDEPAASAEAGALFEHLDGGRVRISDLATGKERRIVASAHVYAVSGGAPTTTAPEAAPFVTSSTGGRFAIVDAGPPARSPLVLGRPPRAFGVAPGARFAAWIAPGGEVSLAEVARGSVRGLGDAGAGPVAEVVLSGDGELVGAVARDPRPSTRVWRGGHEAFTLPAACAFVSDAAGAARFATCEGGRWFDVSGPVPAPIVVNASPPARDVAFDDDAVPAFTARCAGATSALGAPGAHGQAVVKGARAWQAAGASGLAIDAGGVDVWDVATARLRGRISTSVAPDFLYALSVDAALLAMAKPNDLSVDMFRVADGARVRTIALRSAITTLAFRGAAELVVATATQAQGCCWNESPSPRPRYAVAGKVTVFDATTGRVLRTFAGEGFVLDAAGSTIGVAAPGRVAILDAATGKMIATLSGRGRVTALSPSGRFAVLEATSGALGEVTTSIVDLPSGAERVAVRGTSAGVAFDATGARIVLAPVVVGTELTQALVVYDGSRAIREDIPLPEPGARPFFARGGAVLGYETAGGLGFVRLADRRSLAVRGFEHRGACRIYAATPDGAFTGNAEGGLGIRLGDDLAASELLVSGARFEAHRRDDLIARFFDGR